MPKLPPKRAHEDGGVADMQLAFDAVADDTLLPPEPDAKDAGKKRRKRRPKTERKGKDSNGALAAISRSRQTASL